MKTARPWLAIAAIGGFLSVALGAFGAHGLKGHVTPEFFANWTTAAQYLGLHSLALFGCGLLLLRSPVKLLNAAAWAFSAGTLLFAGSLFVMVLTGERWLGMITPIGGLSLLVAWLLLAIGAWRLPMHPDREA